MRVLVDTHVLIWAVGEPHRLSMAIKTRLLDERDERMFSAVSIWEIAIKFALKRPDFTLRPADLMAYASAAGLIELPVTSSAAARVADLPTHHRDPFDRLLIAQAIDTDALLFTADRALAAYGPSVLLAT